MSLTNVLTSWLEVLERHYGIAADPVPATNDELDDLTEFWGCALPDELTELLKVGNGFFADQLGYLLPNLPMPSITELMQYKDPAWGGISGWFGDGGIHYINSGYLDHDNFICIGMRNGIELGVASGGSAHGAVFALDDNRFEWVATSLTKLFEYCLFYDEAGYFEYDLTYGYKLRFAKPGRPVHPKLMNGWSIMPYDPDYDGKIPIGAWQWPPKPGATYDPAYS